MASMESPQSPKTQSLCPDKSKAMDNVQSLDPPMSADTDGLDQKEESPSEPPEDSVTLKSNPDADSVAFKALAGDADQANAETDYESRKHNEVMEEGDNTKSGHEQQLLDWSEREDNTERRQTGGDNPSPKPDLSPVTERVGEADCKTNVACEASETEKSKVENSTEKESTEREKSAKQEEKADGKNQEQAKAAEELSVQSKKRRMVCKECGKIFTRRETFNLHRHFHLHEEDLKPLTCKECGLTFQQRSSFIKHRNEHKENLNKPLSVKKGVGRGRCAFKCAECATVFFSLKKLRNHKCTHSEDVPFHCPICRQDFMYKVAITRHMFTHSKERLKCSECDQTFSDPTSLRTHQVNHVSHKPYECPDCGMAFKQYSLMVDHRRKHTESSDSFPCNVCGKSFKYVGLLQQHQYLHTGKKPFLCSECGKKFAFAQNLKAHYRQHSLNSTPTPAQNQKTNHCNSGPTAGKRSEKENIVQNKDAGRTYSCPLCDQNYTTPANLRNHMRTHEAEYETIEGTTKTTKELQWDAVLKCPHCHTVCPDEVSLNVHVFSAHKSDAPNNMEAQPSQSMDDIQESDSIRPYKCTECGKSFRHRSVLELHKRIHTKDNPNMCKVCGKTFSMSSYLQQHLMTHTGKKPYQCPECGKGFAFLHTMKAHHKLHQEKPFRCTYCTKGYTEYAQLQHHMLSHNGEKPHKCNICEKRFGLAHQLLDHMNTHTGDRPHHCEVCNKSFTWLSSLLVHQKNAHKRRTTDQFNSFPLGERVSDSSSDLRGRTMVLSKPSDTPARDAKLDQISDRPPPMTAVGLDLKPQNKPVLPERPLPAQWKVDGSEILPAPPVQQTFAAAQPFDNRSLLRSMPGQSTETSHMVESSLPFVSSVPAVVPKKPSPSSAPEVEQQRQLKTFPWSSPPSVVASTSSLHTDFTHSGSYRDGAVLWSVRPAAPSPSSHGTPKKALELQFPTWHGAPMPPPASLSSAPKKEEGRAWDTGNPHLQTVSQAEKTWASGLQSVSSLAQMTAHGLGTRWDIQTSPGLQQTLNSPERLVTNPDFHLQQKQVSPSWAGVQSPTTAPNVPISIQYDPRFGQAIGAPLWGFQSSPVGPQTLLKPGSVQDLQHQQPMATGTKIILNQPPPFFPLPPMALPPSHPLHSVSVGALSRPPLPGMFFPPQAVTQTLALSQLPAQREAHKLVRLSFPTDRLHQCMICGCSMPRELDLQMHYMQHAQGKI